MDSGPPQVSPWHWEAGDYLGRKIQWDVYFDPSTRAVINPGLQGSRDVGCLYSTIIIGDPTDPTRAIAVQEGSFQLQPNRLSQNGLDTIDQILALNITAGR